jgi:hypothetical protein
MKLLLGALVGSALGVQFQNTNTGETSGNLDTASMSLSDFIAHEDSNLPQGSDLKFWENTDDQVLQEYKNKIIVAENMVSAGMDAYKTELTTLNRWAEMVDMIMFLQKVPFFGQYWYYGCWCFPDGFLMKQDHHKKGKPVDKVDASCKAQAMCYTCAESNHGEDCNIQERNYKWHGTIDANNKKQIHCDDDEGTCEYSLCMCDRELAKNLAKFEATWNVDYHQKWSSFSTDQCQKSHHSMYSMGEFAGDVFGGARTNPGTKQGSVDDEGQVTINQRAFNFMPSLEKAGGVMDFDQCCGPEGKKAIIGDNEACCSVADDSEGIQFEEDGFDGLDIKVDTKVFEAGDEVSTYNVNTEQCCASGEIAKTGDQCF